MNQKCWPIAESPFNHFAWPENLSVGLVLDGVAIQGLGKQIYQWAGDQPVNAECLYMTTRWEAVADLSPWLVWLSGPGDPVLEGFLKQGPVLEQGYLLVSSTDRITATRWLRGHLQIETVSGCDELMRIAHPALAGLVIGDNLSRCPSGVVERLIVPDCISEQWHMLRMPDVQPDNTGNYFEKITPSPELNAAFEAFNRRKDALQLWNRLEEPVRQKLGGVQLKDAYPKLRKTLDDALGCGCGSLREVMQFLFASLPERANTDSSPQQAPPQDQG
ncbi:DUF4123 domain-containing protein [Marinobacter sp.]|uniref:DUF4123 domain-containing protein n=1 Tax=Marinobacter sp. TaxID=50741 RepID=UPI0034A0E11F